MQIQVKSSVVFKCNALYPPVSECKNVSDIKKSAAVSETSLVLHTTVQKIGIIKIWKKSLMIIKTAFIWSNTNIVKYYHNSK